MTFDFLPPQAYTKETLLKAYNWLQSQSDQIKELATTPDQLVSLFLKSTRLGQDSLQRYANSNTAPSVQVTPPVSNGHADSADRPSLQNFKSELKNLAGMMDNLEKPPVANPNAPIPSYQGPQGSGYQAPMQAYQGPQSGQSQTTYQGPAGATPYAGAGNINATHNTSQASAGSLNQQATSSSTTTIAYVSSNSQTTASSLTYDEYTQNLIREVKNELNLSSDMEALRMLVKIGYQKVRSLYK